MDTTLITETAIISAAGLAGLKIGGELALRRADRKAAARIAQSRAPVDSLFSIPMVRPDPPQTLPDQPERPQDPAGAAEDAPASAVKPEPHRVRGQFARADGSNSFIDAIREQVLAGQNGAGS